MFYVTFGLQSTSQSLSSDIHFSIEQIALDRRICERPFPSVPSLLSQKALQEGAQPLRPKASVVLSL